jgi:hypothetical protein
MNFSYYDLPNDIQSYLASRFGAYGLDPVLAYDYLLPDEIKGQSPEAIEEFMRHKHISHIYPQSNYADMANDLSNVFLEDSTENIMRGNRIATPDDVWQARMDNSSDAFDGDFNDNGILDSLETFFGM